MSPAVVDQATVAGAALFQLTERTVAVTGGGRGLGITIALAVVEAGGHVACIDILPEPAAAEWAALQSAAKLAGVTAVYHRCDVTAEAEVAAVMQKIAEAGRVNHAEFAGLVACAGIQQQIAAVDYPAADFARILQVNTLGVFITAKQAARQFVAHKTAASIVLISSMSGQIANRGLSCTAYNSSKAAVQQMCRSLAQEWGQYGIRINTLSPGVGFSSLARSLSLADEKYIRTAMTDALLAEEPALEKTWMAGALLNRLGVPDDFKAPAIFLLADGSSFMTGADLRVDGGHCASA